MSTREEMMEYQFLVTHGVAKIVRSASNTIADDVKIGIRRAVSIIPCVTLTIQKYFHDWGEHIDVEGN